MASVDVTDARNDPAYLSGVRVGGAGGEAALSAALRPRTPAAAFLQNWCG